MGKDRRPIRRKIQSRRTRDIVKKRNHTRETNKQCVHCIYIQIQEDFKLHFAVDRRKKYVMLVLEKWWVRPYRDHHYSSAAGVYQGVCWALEHLQTIDHITQDQRLAILPVITELNEEKINFIYPWNPKHPVGKKVWKEILELIENLEKSSEEEFSNIVEMCKTRSIKEVNKSLLKS